jgi:hypothetical protein
MAIDDKKMVSFPWGEPEHLTPDFAATQSIEAVNNLTLFEPMEATGNSQLDVAIHEQLLKGAQLVVKWKTQGTETLALGDNIQGVDIVGVAGKTQVATFVFDGTQFVQMAPQVQID